MIRYKIDLLESLKNSGYSTYKILKENIFPQSTMQKFRIGSTDISLKTLERLCELLSCDICDIIEFIPESKENS